MSLQLPLPFELRDDYQLNSFVRGGNAELCARLLALGTSGRAGETLWVHGAAGSGKTHLLQAIVAGLSAEGARIAYLPASQLPVEHVPAMLEGSQNYSVLIIDDVDIWLGVQTLETELVRIYQERRHAELHLVLSAKGAPLDYTMALPDWQSRARGAQVFRLEELNDAGKLEVLVARAERLGLSLSDTAGTYLLRHGPRGLPQMLAVLTEANQLALSEQRQLTLPLLKKTLQNMATTAGRIL